MNSSGGSMEIDLEKDIRDSLVNGKLPCPVAFQIGKRHGISPKQIGEKANELSIKISNCQLGCFP